MHDLQEAVRLHRLGHSLRRIAELLQTGRVTLRKYLGPIAAAGLLDGSPDELPTASALRQALVGLEARPAPTHERSSLEPWRDLIVAKRAAGASPKSVHDYLRHTLGLDAQVTGVELRGDLVQLCNHAAQRLGLVGLAFEQGDVRTHESGPVDVMIALHACDTATDVAIHRGIRAGAGVILCSPCCHKQLRPQMASPRLLQPLLQHGIHMGQEAEMVTDGLRALLLEREGYATQVFEFVSLEHTSKNKMVLAIRRPQPLAPARREELLRQIAEIKAFYGIREQCLETLLGEAAPATAAG